MFTPIIDELIESFKCLPGVGQKTAQRMAIHLLQRNREGGSKLASSLQNAIAQVSQCRSCRILSEQDICTLCANPRRDKQTICVVESPMDVVALEQTSGYSGLYFVLMGRLSPIDGIGPDQIGIPALMARVEADDVQEVIIATNPTVEGEATAHYISELLKAKSVASTRIAHGVPIGGELEYVDGGTLAHALAGRRPL